MATNWSDPTNVVEPVAYAFVAVLLVGTVLLALYTLQFPAVAALVPLDVRLAPSQIQPTVALGTSLFFLGLIGYVACASLTWFFDGALDEPGGDDDS